MTPWLIITATVAEALALACATILVYGQISSREDVRNNLDVLAEVLGSNRTAALSFGDSAGRRRTLGGMGT